MKKNENLVDLNNARKEEQIRVMKQIIANGEDPFMWDNLLKYHQRPILKKGLFWLVTENQWSYDNVRVQLLFIYKENVANIYELPGESYKELLDLAQEFSEKYKIEGGALCMRFGNTTYSGATVSHLHAQLISPQKNAQCAFWLGSQKTK